VISKVLDDCSVNDPAKPTSSENPEDNVFIAGNQGHVFISGNQGDISIGGSKVVRRTGLGFLSTVASAAAVLLLRNHGPWAYVAAGGIAVFALLASGLGIVLETTWGRFWKSGDPEDRMGRRINQISSSLTWSATNLADASALLTDLQEELAGRAKALNDLRREIMEHERLAEISSEASKALDEVIDARMREQARRIARVAWGQGALCKTVGNLPITAPSAKKTGKFSTRRAT
jgi:hypothetical protein